MLYFGILLPKTKTVSNSYDETNSVSMVNDGGIQFGVNF